MKAMDNIQYMGGGTNTAAALESLRTQMFAQGMGARPGVPRIAIVVTDGMSSSTANTIHQADLARQDNIALFSIGVGSNVNQAELEGIANRNADVFNVNSYSELPTLIRSVLRHTCQGRLTDCLRKVLKLYWIDI